MEISLSGRLIETLIFDLSDDDEWWSGDCLSMLFGWTVNDFVDFDFDLSGELRISDLGITGAIENKAALNVAILIGLALSWWLLLLLFLGGIFWSALLTETLTFDRRWIFNRRRKQSRRRLKLKTFNIISKQDKKWVVIKIWNFQLQLPIAAWKNEEKKCWRKLILGFVNKFTFSFALS